MTQFTKKQISKATLIGARSYFWGEKLKVSRAKHCQQHWQRWQENFLSPSRKNFNEQKRKAWVATASPRSAPLNFRWTLSFLSRRTIAKKKASRNVKHCKCISRSSASKRILRDTQESRAIPTLIDGIMRSCNRHRSAAESCSRRMATNWCGFRFVHTFCWQAIKIVSRNNVTSCRRSLSDIMITQNCKSRHLHEQPFSAHEWQTNKSFIPFPITMLQWRR